ncbi:hypothetical protein ACS0TY_020639 [Phlomoides rotata]
MRKSLSSCIEIMSFQRPRRGISWIIEVVECLEDEDNDLSVSMELTGCSIGIEKSFAAPAEEV